MEQQHTQEPWSYEGLVYTDNGGKVRQIVGVDGNEVVGECGLDDDDARRIVACVNACAGVDVAWIESMAKVGGFAAMNQYIAAYNQAAAAINAEKQRDELLSLIKNDAFAMSFQSIGQYRTALIASVKGGAS